MKEITVSRLRSTASGRMLRELVTEPILIVSGRKREPIAVLVPHGRFCMLQELLGRSLEYLPTFLQEKGRVV